MVGTWGMELGVDVGDPLGNGKLLAAWKKNFLAHRAPSSTRDITGGYRSRAWSAPDHAWGRSFVRGEVSAKHYLHLCGDGGGIFSWGDQLVRAKFPLSSVF